MIGTLPGLLYPGFMPGLFLDWPGLPAAVFGSGRIKVCQD